MRIIRRNHRLLVEFDWAGVRYREHGKSRCEVVWPGELPDTVRAAATGLRVSAFVDLGRAAPFLGPETIDGFEPCSSGASAAALRPVWIRFDDG